VHGVAQRVLAEAGEEMPLVRLEAAGLQARLEAVRDVGGAAVDEVRTEALDGRLPGAAEEELLVSIQDLTRWSFMGAVELRIPNCELRIKNSSF